MYVDDLDPGCGCLLVIIALIMLIGLLIYVT